MGETRHCQGQFPSTSKTSWCVFADSEELPAPLNSGGLAKVYNGGSGVVTLQKLTATSFKSARIFTCPIRHPGASTGILWGRAYFVTICTFHTPSRILLDHVSSPASSIPSQAARQSTAAFRTCLRRSSSAANNLRTTKCRWGSIMVWSILVGKILRRPSASVLVAWSGC